MAIRFIFKRDPENNEYHCFNRHLVTPGEALEAWRKGVKNEAPGYSDALTRWAVIKNGRILKVVFRWFEPDAVVYIITAYDFQPKEE